MDEQQPATPPPAPPRPLRTTLGLLLPLGIVAGVLLLVLALLAGGGRWLLASDEGTAWLLRRLPMVQVKGFEGALLGGQWRAQSLRVEWDGGRQWLLLEDLAADGLQWKWRPNDHAWLALRADRVQAARLTIDTGPPSGEPLVLPQSIALPLQLDVDAARVQEVRINQLEPLRALALDKLVLDAQPGARHRVQRLVGDGFGVSVDGAFSVVNTAPFKLDASAALRPTADGDSPRWAAALKAGGSVEQLQLSGTLRGRSVGGREPPSVDLDADLRPLQGWPLASLQLRTEALDLSALVAGAPVTRLAGRADVGGGGGGTPLKAALNLTNQAPGRWNEARLPLRQLTLEVNGQLERREQIEFKRFELQLADAVRDAGRIFGSAVWSGHELKLDARLDGVAPQRLDGRAAAMTIAGPLTATLRGLPSPSASAGAAARPPWHASWKLDLNGRLDAAPQPVRLLLEGSADAQQVELTQVQARSGAAHAELKALLKRTGSGRSGGWSLTTSGSVADFDPLPWWPGDTTPAWRDWRKGPHRVSADWQLDLRLPADAAGLAPLTLAQRIAGNGQLQVKDSVLAGVPLAADVKLGVAATGAAPASLQADLMVGGNRLLVSGNADPAGDGRADRWSAELKADTLATLAPLLRLSPALADWAPRQGNANATVKVEGRWPRMRSEGSARVAQLQANKLALTRAGADWRFDLMPEQAAAQTVNAQLDVSGVLWDKQRVEQLRADLRGSVADHRIDVAGALPYAPPLLAEQMLALKLQAGTRVQLLARGSWLASPAAAGGRWRAQVDRLAVGGWDGSGLGGPGATPPPLTWAEARDLRGEVLLGPDWQLQQLLADAGRLRLGDAVSMRWDAVDIDLRGAEPRVLLRAQIDAFALAPLLARAQPTVGWSGDLKLAARVDIRAAERVDADIVFERTEGDLHLQTGDGVQLMGLTDVRLSLSAHDGVWLFTPLLRGRSIGDISGRIQARTTPERRWPHADAPIEGSVQAQVADIGIWSAWVPAGWRLAGEVRGTAGVAGRFGAPQYFGEINGSRVAVRNLLQGVNISDANIAVKLQGETAQIERFTLRGGDGTLTVTGGAVFGAKPQARLQFVAQRFRVLGRVDRNIIASGQAELVLSPDGGRLDGKITVDEGLIDASRSDAPSLDDDVNVRGRGSPAQAATDTETAGQRKNFVLAVDVDLGNKLHVRGRGLDTMLEGQLRLSTPNGRFAVNGTISTEGGTYKAYGQNLVIERGILGFNGAVDNPAIDVLAIRPNLDRRVGVAITGSVQTPRVRLFAEPEMSEMEKLSWLMLGRAPDELGRNDTALLQRAALALLAGEREAPTDQLMKSLGIDEVSLRQTEGDTRETVITIGKQLSRRWYLGYERGVNSTEGTFQLTYRIAQRFTLRLASGLENAVDVIWVWRLQETPTDPAMRKSVVLPP